MPTTLQTPGKLGFVQPGFAPTRPARSARFGSLSHSECVPGLVPASYEGEPNTYPGSWEPFYYDANTWYNDSTLQYQAPRPGPGFGPSNDAWYDPTLTMQAERGPDVPYGPQGAALGAAGDVKEMSTGVKIAFALGAAALIVGGSVLVVRHTFREGLWPQ